MAWPGIAAVLGVQVLYVGQEVRPRASGEGEAYEVLSS